VAELLFACVPEPLCACVPESMCACVPELMCALCVAARNTAVLKWSPWWAMKKQYIMPSSKDCCCQANKRLPLFQGRCLGIGSCSSSPHTKSHTSHTKPHTSHTKPHNSHINLTQTSHKPHTSHTNLTQTSHLTHKSHTKPHMNHTQNLVYNNTPECHPSVQDRLLEKSLVCLLFPAWCSNSDPNVVQKVTKKKNTLPCMVPKQ